MLYVLQILGTAGLVLLLVLHKHLGWLREPWFNLPAPKQSDPAWFSILAAVLGVFEWFRTNLFSCSMCLGFWTAFFPSWFGWFLPVPGGVLPIVFGVFMGGTTSLVSFTLYVVVRRVGAL